MGTFLEANLAVSHPHFTKCQNYHYQHKRPRTKYQTKATLALSESFALLALRGHAQMTSAERGREGGYLNSDGRRGRLHDLYSNNSDKGGRGSKIPKI